MKNKAVSIRKIVGILNNEDEAGGFWLPNIQRPFVWNADQIVRLFDSIMREYPISTLLIWNTTSPIKSRKFIDNWNDSLKLGDFLIPVNARRKSLVLDGQQRLQSLFIGLKGSFEGKELCFDVLSGEMSDAEDIKYVFKFLAKDAIKFPFVRIRDLVFEASPRRQKIEMIARSAPTPPTDEQKGRIDENLELVDKTFRMEERISYQELDSIDNPTLYTEDDVVEIFIRANSGGTRLGKSDLLFSLLSASWEESNEQIETLLDSINRYGFACDRDFILKTCLVLIGKGASYEVEKFRDTTVRAGIEAAWPTIEQAIQSVFDFVRGKTFIQCDKAIPSYLALIPLIYFRYKHPNEWRDIKNADTYLIRSLLVGAFSGQPDGLIDRICRRIDETRRFDYMDILHTMESSRRNIHITEDRLWSMGYGSANIHLLFNLWYKDFAYSPAYVNNLPQVDHIFPQSVLKAIRIPSPDTGRPVMRYKDAARNQLLNCMLLTREENGAGEKGATLPEVWFGQRDAAYRDRHLIPHDPALWKVENFEAFLEARKALIREKFSAYLAG